MTNFVDLWVYLSGSPLLWLTTTLIAYLAADTISASPLCNRCICRLSPEAAPASA